jgi:hypothetical protein
MANATTRDVVPRRIWLTGVDRLILRVAFGVTLAFAIAMVLDWELFFLAPLLAAGMLFGMPAMPGFVPGILIPLAATVACNVALVAAYLFAGTPQVLLLTVGLTLCWTFYGHRRGLPHILMLVIQLSVAVVAVFSVTSLDAAREFSDAFQEGCIGAIATVWISHTVIPAPPAPPSVTPPPQILPPAWAARVAFCDTLIIMPMIGSFMLESTVHNTVYITTGLIVLGQLEPTARRRDADQRLFGQILGGLMAVGMQQVVLIMDSLVNFLLVVFLAALWLARRVVRSGPAAAGLYVQALSAFILVIGLGVLKGGSEEYYAVRILKISTAVLYIYAALSLLSRLRQAPSLRGG